MIEKVLLWPYYFTLKLRHSLYDKGIWKSFKVNAPTICIGNITAGGTGKTPHTEMILRTLQQSEEWGLKEIAVLSRGHRRKSHGFQQVTSQGSSAMFGDEPLQIKKKFPGITVAVDRDRVEGCHYLLHPEALQTDKNARGGENSFPKADIIVLDDAFQHRRLQAYYNIILVDYNRPLYKDRLLPFGRLRDLPERLVQADVIIVTKCPAFMEDWEKIRWAETLNIRDFSPVSCTGKNAENKTTTVLFSTIQYQPLEPVYEDGDVRFTYSNRLILFTGIAKDTPLRRFLSDKYHIVRRFTFLDHHKYTRHDIAAIRKATRYWPTAVVATTEKDSQRVLDYKRVPADLRHRLFQIPISVAFLSEHEKDVFERTLLDALRAFPKK